MGWGFLQFVFCGLKDADIIYKHFHQNFIFWILDCDKQKWNLLGYLRSSLLSHSCSSGDAYR